MLTETTTTDTTGLPMGPCKHIALIAHDNRKRDLVEWARFNRDLLAGHNLSATGTTGALLAEVLGLEITRFRSGPLGGDQQVGAKIAEGDLDLLIFFWDPLEPHPHDVDVKALLRIAVVYNIPVACNRASADFMISSPLLSEAYLRRVGEPESRPTALWMTRHG
ncbi:MAG: methylglyoxal synthase [Acidimicrobiia bacterium]|nr:methylglyoxal synthase [Acidimicrobiia bacterium]